MPREGIRLLFELLVVEMAASSRPLFPSRCQDDVTTVSQLDTFNWLGGEDCEFIIGDKFACRGWDDDEWTLRWLVERVEGCNVIVLVRGLLVPLIRKNL